MGVWRQSAAREAVWREGRWVSLAWLWLAWLGLGLAWGCGCCGLAAAWLGLAWLWLRLWLGGCGLVAAAYLWASQKAPCAEPDAAALAYAARAACVRVFARAAFEGLRCGLANDRAVAGVEGREVEGQSSGL